MSQDYNQTLHLPKTDFPMRAGLPKREPAQLAKWEEMDLYALLMEKNKDKPLFLLHDGPPYANGDIHMGTALNKVLKDFVVRYKNMSGFRAPYTPGWDTHGLPIESQIIKRRKLNRAKMSVADFRDQCRDFALEYVDRQREQFKRLGGLGDWAHPYLTLTKNFEARQVEVFGEMARKGYIYKGLKPVYWCPQDQTALAEAEIEYAEDPCESVYVRFAVRDGKGKTEGLGTDVYFAIWTTTVWTLPGNVAICLHPDLEYAALKVGDAIYIVADALKEGLCTRFGAQKPEVAASWRGRDLEGIVTRHPFLDRDSLVILGDHVTAESGTGCVHTAPGHGAEDFYVGQDYGLPVVVPVDDKGFMTEESGPFAGLYYEKANEAILDVLRQKGALLSTEQIKHTYPHCWRCKDPVLFRATEQWFASVEAIKADTEKAIQDVRWYPAWGKERMSAMVRERADWCVSRQRQWGVPIPIFYCDACGKELVNDDTISAVSKLFAEQGANAWYEKDAAEILPPGTVCPACGQGAFHKETDIMDVWFDSGTSHISVMEDGEGWPADLYLEGHDQFRGWYQSSLLTSVAVRGRAPYRAVVSHGWILDEEARKMSKSLGNVMIPGEVMNQVGADVLRLWVSSTDYQSDVRVSKDIFVQLSESYLKLRNTARFLLGNLHDYDPENPPAVLEALDRWALHKLQRLIARVRESYEKYEYHTVFHAIHNFCVVDMSNFYLDVIKDRLYCDEGELRRSAQAAMYNILSAITRLLAPILAFTTDEIWRHMRHLKHEDDRSVVLNPMPEPASSLLLPPEEEKRWERLIALREEVNKALEGARTGKVIGKSLDAAVRLTAAGEEYAFLREWLPSLPALLIVSDVKVSEGERKIEVARAPGEKCLRCWGYFENLGSHPDHPELCPRCSHAVS